MNINTGLKSTVAITALVAIGAPVIVSSANAGLNNGNKNGVVMSGQIVRALIYQDDGHNSQLFNTDGFDTASRIRWIITGQMTESVSMGGLVEMNFPNSNRDFALGTAGANNGEVDTDTAFAIRHSRIDFTHKAAGKLSLGQSSVAGDGATSQTFTSYPPVISASADAPLSNSTFWNNTTSSLSTVGQAAIEDYDPSREDRIRYDTPSFGGLSLAISHQDTGQSVGANYAAKYGDVQVAAAAFFKNNAGGSTTQTSTAGGSIAVKHSSGLSADISYSKEESEAGILAEGKNWHAGLGYAADLTNLGTTGFGFIYSVTEEGAADNDEGTQLAVTVNQKVASVGADLFAGFTYATYDDGTSTDFDDFSTIFTGARLNF